MDRKRVLEALETLNAELVDATQVDPEAREHLQRLTAQVRDAVAQREGTGQGNDASDHISGLQDALLGFEAEHPQLAGAINQVAVALANLGI